MKDLKVLNLSIPTLDSSECKPLMGGDGYAWEIELPEVVVTPDNEKPDPTDYDNLDDILDDGQNDFDYDNDYDNDHDNDYKVPDELKGAFEMLPEKFQEFLKENNIKINYDPNYRNSSGGPASYSSEYNYIITSILDDNTILREAFHAFQDINGALDEKSHSAEEFQEQALGDLADYFDSMFKEVGGGFGFSLDFGYNGDSNWSEFVGNCFDNDGNFDRDAFKEGIMDYFEMFQKAHEDVDGYNDPLEDNYNWNWDEFFDMLGF